MLWGSKKVGLVPLPGGVEQGVSYASEKSIKNYIINDDLIFFTLLLVNMLVKNIPYLRRRFLS